MKRLILSLCACGLLSLAQGEITSVIVFPGGDPYSVQYSSGDIFTGTDTFKYNPLTKLLTVPNITSTTSITNVLTASSSTITELFSTTGTIDQIASSTIAVINVSWSNRGTKMNIGVIPFLQLGLGNTPNMFLGLYSGNPLLLTAYGNTSFGSSNMYNATDSAHSNTAMGVETLANCLTCFENTIGGYRAAWKLETGLSNAVWGSEALRQATSASNCAILGPGAAQNTNSSRLTIVGYGALGDNTGTSSSGSTAVGTESQTSLLSGINTTVGDLSLGGSTSADGVTAVGRKAAQHSNGANSEFIGDEAAYNHLIGNHNFIGGSTGLFEGTTVYDTVGIGYGNLYYAQSSSNTVVGSEGLSQLTIGGGHVGIGYLVGRGTNPLTTGNNDVLIGYKAAVSTGDISNSIALGANSIVTASNTCQIGGSANSSNAMDLNVASITAGGVNFSSVTLDDVSSRQLYVSSTVFIGLSIDSITALGLPPQASEKLTVSGPGGVPGASNIDILSMNTSTWGARVVAYGGGSPGNHAVGIVGATGNTSPTFGWGGGPSFNQSAFVELQTVNPGMFHVTGNATSYFYISANDSAWYFVRKNGIFNAGLENEKLRLIPYPGVFNENGSLFLYASPSTTNQNLNLTNVPLVSTRTYTFPDVGTNASFIMSESTGTQLISTGGLSIKGTTTNDSASAGYIGEYTENIVTVSSNCGSSGSFFDATMLSLSPGDWDVSAMLMYTRNGATYATDTYFIAGITQTPGNNSTGISYGVNAANYADDTAATTYVNHTLTVPSYRVSLNATTMIYLKGYTETYNAGNPTYKCRLSARRMR